jgi:hypothetical protein
MSDHDTLPPEVDEEIRARLQAFAREVAEHVDTDTALERMPRRSGPPTTRLLAIAACLLAVVAVAAVLIRDRQAVDTDLSSPTTECLGITQPRAITPGGPMKMRFAAPAASAATAMMLLGACDDDGPTTLAQGEDVEFVGDAGLAGQTLNVSAEEEDGEVTGEWRVSNVVVRVECANTDTDGVVILGGEVTTSDPESRRGDPAAVGELNALIIREGDPDSAALHANVADAGSCTELLESLPADALTNESYFVDVEAGEDIETG